MSHKQHIMSNYKNNRPSIVDETKMDIFEFFS